MNGKHISKYRNKGYICNVGDIIEVKIKDIPSTSKVRIDAKCSICNEIKETNYASYLLSISKGGFYACSQKCSNKKVRITNIERYGVDVPAKNKEVLNKMKKTCLELYGIENAAKLEINTEKAKKTKLIKYGSETYSNHEKYIKTNLKKYGVDNPSKLESIKNKKKETCFNNYGVDSPSQNIHVYHKSFKHKKYKHLTYQSSYELNFILFCEELGIKIEDVKFNIDYTLNEKNRKYYPDFHLPDYNLICEVKSTYTMNCKYDENKQKELSTINKGYNFLFIVDNNFDKIKEIINYSLTSSQAAS